MAVARQLKADRRRGESVPPDRTAVVFKSPLPYLYLAGEVFGAAGIPYRTSDALPLAAEQTSAAIDLVLDAAGSDFTRDTLVALLRSPHFVFHHDGEEVGRAAAAALDRALSRARYLGGIERLDALAWMDGLGVSAALHAGVAIVRVRRSLGIRLRQVDACCSSGRARSTAGRRRSARAARSAPPPSTTPCARSRCHAAAIAVDAGRSGHRRQARHRGSDLRAGVSRRRPASRGRSGRALRRLRRCDGCGGGGAGLARASAAQHFLPADAAEVARMAVGKGSPLGGRRAFSRSPRLGVAADLGLHLHARRGRARLAVDAARGDSARSAVHGGASAVRTRARVRGRGALVRTCFPRAARPGGAGVGRTARHAFAGRRPKGSRNRPRHRARSGARLVGERARDLSRLPVQVFRAARAEARGRT